MKKILYLMTLFVFITIGLIYNSMYLFANNNNNEIGQKNKVDLFCSSGETCNYEVCTNENVEDVTCLHSCCIGNKTNQVSLNINVNFYSVKKVKIKNYSFLDFERFNLYSLYNKNLISINSPPYISKRIPYYYNLIKIIKSNT